MEGHVRSRRVEDRAPTAARGAVTSSHQGPRRRHADRRQHPGSAARLVRPGHAPDLLPPAAGRAGRAVPARPAVGPVSTIGRHREAEERSADHRLRRRGGRPGGRACGPAVPRLACSPGRHRGLLDLHLGCRSELVRGGTGGARPRPRPEQAGRHRAERSPRARRARRRGAGRVPAAPRPVRDLAADPVVPPARGRAPGAAGAVDHRDPMPVQGHRELLVGAGRSHAPRGSRLDLSRSDHREPTGRGAGRLLQRARRPDHRRCATGRGR